MRCKTCGATASPAEVEALLEFAEDVRTFFEETVNPTGAGLPQDDRNRVSSKTIKQFERWTNRYVEAMQKAAR